MERKGRFISALFALIKARRAPLRALFALAAMLLLMPSARAARLLLGLSLAAALLSAFALLRVWWKEYRTERCWREIAEARTELGETDWTGWKLSPRLSALYERNPYLVGWLSMEDAFLDYPVMQTRDDPEYYLRRNFDGEYDSGGTPFADSRCQVTPVQGFNTVIYLHNTRLKWLKQYAGAITKGASISALTR